MVSEGYILIFDDDDDDDEDLEFNHEILSKNEIKKERKLQWLVFVSYNICMAALIFVGYGWLWVTSPESTTVIGYADFMGIFGSVIVIIQFVPEIYEVFKNKESGTLSFVMLCVQTPGTWIWWVYLITIGAQDWSTWLSTLVAAINVTILLGEVIYFDHVKPRLLAKSKGEVANTVVYDNETIDKVFD
eukprot:TRINITY_DN618_c3_g1_i1.p2 TRINITY_DN618_c3_g1~~TRINITY_DN618_c3_g1_i1.p2  ORF type:complete len:188 (-),score=65.83 TRINITY_DN618_c3_g1_i1:200-763(-)